MDGWLLYGGRICGSNEGMIIVVAIDTEGYNHLLVTMREAETVEKALASDVTSRFQPTQVGHSGCIAGWLLYGGRIWGSHEGMIVVVAIDTEYLYRLLVTLEDAETLE